MIERSRRQLGKLGREFRGRLVGAIGEGVRIVELQDLLGDDLRHLLPPVADVHAPQAADSVEIPLAGGVGHIGAIGAFVKMIREALPNLLARFESMWATTSPGMEDEALLALYLSVPVANFSDEVLSARPSALAVLRASGLGWSDLGEPERVLSLLNLEAAPGNGKG